MARVVAVGTAVPPYRLDATAARDVLIRAFAPRLDDARAVLRMAANAGVRERYLSCPADDLLKPRSLGETNRRYAEMATALAEQAARQALARAGLPPTAIDLVVTTSCTGYMLPALDACLVERLGLRPETRRLPITELGCLAGAAALSYAVALLAGLEARTALVIAVELPSLTFQPDDASMDNVVSALVFGDGAGAAVLRADEGEGMALIASRAAIVPGTLGAMGFDLRDDGFHVTLSKDVPRLLARPFAAAASALLADHGLAPGDLRFACIHPGGPKILRAVDAALGAEGLTAPSWEVLARFGNQSSAAVLFVLEQLFATPPLDNTYGLLAAFGPGLSLELGLLQWHG